MTELASRPLMTIRVDVGPPLPFGDCGGGERRCVPILGGSFDGAINGTLLPGADWQTQRADGTLEIAAHYGLKTSSGSLIEVESLGLRHGPPEVIAALLRGEQVEPHLYYFRTAMRFKTADPELARFSKLLATSHGRREASRVTLDVFEIL